MKDEFGGVIVDEFVGLKSKMYSMKKIDGKEYNTAKGVSIATEFDKFKDVLFIEKIIRHKIKEFKVKSINQEHLKLTKYLCTALTIKDMCQMMKFVRWLIFIKIMLQVLKRLKKTLIIEKDCNN